MVDTGRRADAAQSPPPLDDGRLLDMYRQMVLCRTLDERVWLLNRQGCILVIHCFYKIYFQFYIS